ncbi:substrate-binding domain-containing protein [Phytohabitans rumicis]|uniref:Sugar ABC transporter substrate-binding protein n=1 Tax=Phytohabitans rumicis TaxID=1076125 RepID=A0A6V8KSZ2_9ACTN|nr:substrate-binding domain-containing protein [Phytohabitans rumicis]GFJ86934.1 sugar ABC transporter substrate-binding protein [Phytohabitans rumicis]
MVRAAQRTRRSRVAAVGALVVVYAGLTGCPGDPDRDAAPPPGAAGGAACPEAFAEAKAAVAAAEVTTVPWTGPTTGPRAPTGKTVVYIAQIMTNPGVAGAARGAVEAAHAVGWNLELIDGQGSPSGIQSAFTHALALNPDGIIVGGFDPGIAALQLAEADARGIPVVGWHAVGSPGPSQNPKLFTNITTKVEDVARISAQWIILHSGGTAGVVVFTDASIPFARRKSELITAALQACPAVRVLSTEDIPIPEGSTRTPRHISALVERFGDSWTHSVAINDLYFADAASALRKAGKRGAGPPYNIGAGDGDPVAFERIRGRQYEAATVPEPLLQQGWQIIDELNRAIARRPSSNFVPPVHLTTTANVGGATYWEPDNGYRNRYMTIWGR